MGANLKQILAKIAQYKKYLTQLLSASYWKKYETKKQTFKSPRHYQLSTGAQNTWPSVCLCDWVSVNLASRNNNSSSSVHVCISWWANRPLLWPHFINLFAVCLCVCFVFYYYLYCFNTHIHFCFSTDTGQQRSTRQATSSSSSVVCIAVLLSALKLSQLRTSSVHQQISPERSYHHQWQHH